MKIFNLFRKKSEVKTKEDEQELEQNISVDLFENAPVLFPWHVGKDKPLLVLKNNPLYWNWVEKTNEEYVGYMTLNDEESVLGICNFYTYVQVIQNGELFCVWTRNTSLFELYSTNDLKPFTNTNDVMLQLRSDKKLEKEKSYLFNCNPQATVSFDLQPNNDFISVVFPEKFKVFDEIIAVTDIPNLYPDKKDDEYWGKTTIVVLKPKENIVYVYPQDWFNKDKYMDFDYQWITRAARNQNNGNICVTGIRLGIYELDETNRQINKRI